MKGYPNERLAPQFNARTEPFLEAESKWLCRDSCAPDRHRRCRHAAPLSGTGKFDIYPNGHRERSMETCGADVRRCGHGPRADGLLHDGQYTGANRWPEQAAPCWSERLQFIQQEFLQRGRTTKPGLL